MQAFIVTVIGIVASVQCGCSEELKSQQASPPDLITKTNQKQGTRENSDAEDILRQSRKAYAALKSYSGSIRLENTWSYSGRSRTHIATSKIHFSRPKKLRIEGRTGSDFPYMIVSDGETISSTDLRSDTDGAFESHKSVAQALSEWTGVSNWVSTTLPGILMDVYWDKDTIFLPDGSFLNALATHATLDGHEQVEGRKCHRIVCPRDIATWTLSVDVDDHLIRRIKTTCSREQINVQRKYGGGGRSGQIIAKSNDQIFTIESTNQTLDDSLFVWPGKMR